MIYATDGEDCDKKIIIIMKQTTDPRPKMQLQKQFKYLETYTYKL